MFTVLDGIPSEDGYVIFVRVVYDGVALQMHDK